MTVNNEKTLYLKFHGRIIDSLGIQMYQSPVAAIAELIANAWDADATEVSVRLAASLEEAAEIEVRDNGLGMTFAECQDSYLNVGRNRRLSDQGKSGGKGRAVLGRKGIGKFAGFGIARILEVDTTSAATGERTAFHLDLDTLRSDEFVSSEKREIKVLLAERPDEDRKKSKGTIVRLKSLAISRRPTPESFAQHMARRFVLAQAAGDFQVTINGVPLPTDAEPIGNPIEFVFPRDYKPSEKPDLLRTLSDSWAEEELPDGKTIKWQVKFTEKPIGEEDFRGVAVYCGIKVAQTPFFFQLGGGLAGQHGQQYLTGRVQADYLDHLTSDVITTERQRINWESPEAQALLSWGQERVKEFLKLWQSRRAEKKVEAMEGRLEGFARRLAALPSSEARIVKGTLLKLAGFGQLDDEHFRSVANAILTSWEGGRLRAIIEEVARLEQMDAPMLLRVLAEQQVLTTLHVGEAVRLKVDIVEGLKRRVRARDLENDIRDYIARHPWLISPEWETFQVETRIAKLMQDAAGEAGITADVDWKGRVDLALSAGDQLLVLEFMRPGLSVDRDHIDRYQRYVDILRARVSVNTTLGFRVIRGILVADKIHRRPEDHFTIERMAKDGMQCMDWEVLLARAESQWKEFLGILTARAPDDERISALRNS